MEKKVEERTTFGLGMNHAYNFDFTGKVLLFWKPLIFSFVKFPDEEHIGRL